MNAVAVQRFSHTKITNATAYNSKTGLPTNEGLMDANLGAEGDVMCRTCLNSARNGYCSGHTGHVKLQTSVIHPSYHKIIMKLLNCVCVACGALLMCDQIMGDNIHTRIMNAAKAVSRRAACPHCNLPNQPEFTNDSRLSIKATWSLPKPRKKGKQAGKSRKRSGSVARSHRGTKRAKLAIREQQEPEDDANKPWSEEELREIQRLVPAEPTLDMLTTVLHQAFTFPEPRHNIRTRLGLAPDLTADALIIRYLHVGSKMTRPTRTIRGRRHVHDLTTRLRFVVAPNVNLRDTKHHRRAFDKGELTTSQVRKLLDFRGTNTSALKMFNGVIDFNERDLQTQVVNLMDSDVSLAMERKQRGGKKSTASGIKQILSGKNGIVRGNTRGGRVQFSGRAALAPAPVDWPVDVCGLPQHMAKVLSKPVKVTSFNIDLCRQWIMVGWQSLGGANIVENTFGGAVFLRELTPAVRHVLAFEELEVGWTVHRCLQDGDYVLVNRPPTLWCMNLMAFRIRIIKEYTLMLSHLLAKHFNFDFDGDALIVHAPQRCGIEAQMRIMTPLRYVINPTHGRPVMVPTLNTPMAIWLLTAHDLRLSRGIVNQLMAAASAFIRTDVLVSRLGPARDVNRLGEPLWTGRQVLSTLLLPVVWFGDRGALRDADAEQDDAWLHTHVDDVVVVERGQLVCGQLHGKRTFSGNHSLTQVIERDFGQRAACTFLEACMSMGAAFLALRGCSLGPNDLLQSRAMKVQADTLRTRSIAAMELVEQARGGARLKEQLRVAVANQYLTQATGMALANRSGFDMLLEMTGGGAKGSTTDVAQMRVGLGQQLADGRRVLVDHDANARRSIPCFAQGCHSAEAHGLITTGFGSVDVDAIVDDDTGEVLGGGRLGLAPHHMFMHAFASNIAMASTSVGVPKTGDLQNRLANGGQFAVVRGNMPCRMVFSDRGSKNDPQFNNTGKVESVSKNAQSMIRMLQLNYGDNCCDVQLTHQVRMPWLKDSNEALRSTLGHDARAALPGLPPTTIEHVVNAWARHIIGLRAVLRTPSSNYVGGQAPLTQYPLAMSMHREMQRTMDAWPPASHAAPQVTEADLQRIMATLHARLLEPLIALCRCGPANGTDFQMLPHMCDAAWHVRPWRLTAVPPAALRDTCDRWLHKVRSSLVDNGTSVGMLAVYAIGAAATQAELDKFHHVGQEQRAGITLLQRTRELTEAKIGMTGAPKTWMVMNEGIPRDTVQAWMHQNTYVDLGMLLRPLQDNGAMVLFLPTDMAELTECEHRAWTEQWQTMGYATVPPREVLLLRISRTACDYHHMTWERVLKFVRRELAMATGGPAAARTWRRALDLHPEAPDMGDVPLIASTQSCDPEWSIIASHAQWSQLEHLRTVTAVEECLNSPEQYGGTEPDHSAWNGHLTLSALALYMYRGLLLQGSRHMKQTSLGTRTLHRFDRASGTTHASERHMIEAQSCIPASRVRDLHVAGVVDFRYTVWNDIKTTWDALGVEAARATWLHEIQTVAGGGVSVSHLLLLADIVFAQGYPKSIVVRASATRDGFMAASAAEKPTVVYADAALRGATDPLLGSAALFVGQAGTCGTRSMDIVTKADYIRHVQSTEFQRLVQQWEQDAPVVQVPRAEQHPVVQVAKVQPQPNIQVPCPSPNPSPDPGVELPPDPLLPASVSGSVSASALQRVAVADVHMPSDDNIPSDLFPGDKLPRNLGMSFEGERQRALAPMAAITVHAPSYTESDEALRRLRGELPMVHVVSDGDGESNDELAARMDNRLVTAQHQLKSYQKRVPQTILQAARRAMTQGRGTHVRMTSTTQPEAQFGIRDAHPGAHHQRGLLQQLKQASKLRLTAEQRRVQEESIQRRAQSKRRHVSRRVSARAQVRVGPDNTTPTFQSPMRVRPEEAALVTEDMGVVVRGEGRVPLVSPAPSTDSGHKAKTAEPIQDVDFF